MTKLSIIIPCYNCERTLEAAVDSIYQQESAIPFDVTLVDDGSDDGTYETMKSLAEKHPGIQLVRHAKNLGGGAARNTAAAHSDGELLFCLDADDMLGPDFLSNLTRFWLSKKCDGVGISRSVKFRKFNTRDVAYVTEFDGPGRQVPFESLLDGSACSLTSTFLIRRRAFDKLGGYPTAHGFDTQGMAFRFLGNGLVAYTCPDTVYYHRVDFHDSYYVREQRTGRLNWNWLQVLDEFTYLFNEDTQRRLFESQLFSIPGQAAAPDLLGAVRGRADVYAREYRSLISLGWAGVARRLRTSRNKVAQYWLGNDASRRGRPRTALAHYARALELGFQYPIIHYRMLAASLQLSPRQIPVENAIAEFTRYYGLAPEARLSFGQWVFQAMLSKRLLWRPAIFAKDRWDIIRKRGST